MQTMMPMSSILETPMQANPFVLSISKYKSEHLIFKTVHPCVRFSVQLATGPKLESLIYIFS